MAAPDDRRPRFYAFSAVFLRASGGLRGEGQVEGFGASWAASLAILGASWPPCWAKLAARWGLGGCLGPKLAARWGLWGVIVPKLGPRWAKLAARWGLGGVLAPKLEPRWAKLAAKWGKHAPRWGQDGQHKLYLARFGCESAGLGKTKEFFGNP